MGTEQDKTLSNNQMFNFIKDELSFIRVQLKEQAESLARVREKLAGNTVRISYISAAVALVVAAVANWLMK